MRGQGLGRVTTLDRLASNDASRFWVRLVASRVVAASEEIWVFPAVLAGISVAQVGLLL